MSIEISEAVLNYSLVSLAVMGVITLGFLAKLFYDCSKLAQNANKTTEIVNAELKPTLDELNTALKSFNKIVKNTGDGVDSMKLGIGNVITKTKIFSGNLMSGFLKGFLAVYGLFSKKK